MNYRLPQLIAVSIRRPSSRVRTAAYRASNWPPHLSALLIALDCDLQRGGTAVAPAVRASPQVRLCSA